jgi:hypothetical protein
VKVAVGSVLVLLLFAVAGAAYQAGSGPGAGKDKGRPLTELEALRRENELLKLNLEVVLEKVQAQEAELRSLRGKRIASASRDETVKVWDLATGKAIEVKPDGKALEAARQKDAERRAVEWAEAMRAYERVLELQRNEVEKLKAQERAAKEMAAQATANAREAAFRKTLLGEKRRADESLEEVRKALKDLQEARDKGQTQRAIEALEKALEKMKEQEGLRKK